MGYDPSARRKLGSAPLEVIQLGLGCGPLGGFRATIGDDEAQAILRAAYDAGVRLFDTAPLYGYGRSELRVGQALRQLPRESFVCRPRSAAGSDRSAPASRARAGGPAASSSYRPTISATTA